MFALKAFVFLQASMCKWDLSTEIITDRSTVLWRSEKSTLRYKQLCLLPPRKCIYREMENRLACQSLSSTPDSHCKWRWPRPWTGRACRWDRRTPRRGPEHFQNPPLRPGAGSACAPSQHPAPAAQETAWRARTTQGETTEVCWINKEISLRFNLFT